MGGDIIHDAGAERCGGSTTSMQAPWGSQRVKRQGDSTLRSAVTQGDRGLVRHLVTQFIKIRAGQKLLRDRGIDCADGVDSVVDQIVTVHDGSAPTCKSNPTKSRLSTPHRRSVSGQGIEKCSEIARSRRSVRTVSQAELREWTRTLDRFDKYLGVCCERYRSGMLFKKVLLALVLDTGLGTKPSELREHKHHPSALNISASALCNECGAQATCECHSAGSKSIECLVHNFIAEAVEKGLTRVSFVTGLGGHGGGGTIRQMMPGLLQQEPMVAEFELASNCAAIYANLTDHC